MSEERHVVLVCETLDVRELKTFKDPDTGDYWGKGYNISDLEVAYDREEGDYPCYLCGRATSGKRGVEIINGDAAASQAFGGVPYDNPWYRGCYPVGSKCIKKLPKDTHITMPVSYTEDK